MDPIWYTIRIIATAVMTAIGVFVLWVAYLVAPNVNGNAVAWMVLEGLAIPIGFFAMFTLVGWQRSTVTTATPNAVIAWCNDRRRYPILLVLFLLLLFGGARQIANEIQYSDSERAATQAYGRMVRDTLFDACWLRAANTLQDDAGAAVISLRPRMLSYCTCLDIEVENTYTPQQFAAIPKDRWWQSGDEKIDRIVQTCRIEDSSLVRAAQMIRKTGGDPESEAMRGKILAYTACVKLELKSGYTPANLMTVSTDPAWQDGNAEFRQIIDRCRKYAEL